MVAVAEPSDGIEVTLDSAVSAAGVTDWVVGVPELLLELELELDDEDEVPWKALSPPPPQAVSAAAPRSTESLNSVRIMIPGIDRRLPVNRC
jgi:hypothetical protein